MDYPVSPILTHQFTNPCTSAEDKRGFALLITVTLLAFLVLLLVSLATLTRVETQVAANNQSLAQARQNALMAMDIAIGQLQKYAGPDARVTARAEVTSTSAVTNPYFTGTWDASGSGAAASTWLVSGSEVSTATAAAVLSDALDPSNDTVTDATLFLVGDRSVALDSAAPTAAEKARRIKLVKQDINAPAGMTPGLNAAATPRIGRYAWWVGDQSVKASLALPDRADEVTYAPWDTQTQRRRIRQQIASMPNYFRASTATTTYVKEGFDPLTIGTLLGNVKTEIQFGLVTPVAGTMPDFMRGHYHDFTTATRAVLANTRTDAHSGLMRDLSLKPDELGQAYVGYANYGNYMETPGQTVTDADAAYPAITDVDSPRRRYKISAPVSAASATDLPDLVYSVAPVMTEFMLQFKFEHTSSGVLTIRSRLYVAFWNPYTAALAPTSTDNLALEVTGLPQVTVTDDVTAASTTVNLQTDLGPPINGSGDVMKVGLPFGNTMTAAGTQADRSSWLPGRVYGWTTETGPAPTGNLQFYNKNISAQGWAYPTKPLSGSTNKLAVRTSGAISGLTIRLKSGADVLATYTTPSFKQLDIAATTTTWKFAFATRIKQPVYGDSERTWLKTFDPRHNNLSAMNFGGFDVNQDITPLDPAVYQSSTAPTTVYTQYLLYRIQGSLLGSFQGLALDSYNDVPVFELPRLPLLSAGELQHMQVKDTRPFAIGNSWGGTANAIFDRYFFSGLPSTTTAAAGVPDLSAGQPLPNWNLQVVDTSSTATLQADAALSSKHLLQAGGFNVNSTSTAAWRAILSSVRFGQAFVTADIETANSSNALGTQKSQTTTVTGTVDATFSNDATLGSGAAAPTFSRFSQSAQETYFWKPVSGTTNKREFSTHAFRLGVRGSEDQSVATSTVDASVTAQRMTTDQVEALATEIVKLLKLRASTKGPFRTLEEFLGPQAGAGSASLLEVAIANTTINPAEVQPLDNVTALSGGGYGAGFSSLTLTQADILTALAPYLRARSDTFTIRSYGEALNPVTTEVTGKAWLEATVQRFPETVDSSDNIENPTGPFGRRFKIISFRWLSPSDI